jgi:hypothetical protein
MLASQDTRLSDPERADRLRLARTFSVGPITFRRLLERFPRLTLAGDPPRRPTWVLRGFQSIEVDCV